MKIIANKQKILNREINITKAEVNSISQKPAEEQNQIINKAIEKTANGEKYKFFNDIY